MLNLTPPIFRKSLAVTGFLALSSFVSAPVHAISFNFSWSNNGANIVSGGASPANLTAVGTLDINRNAGETFTFTDITNINILATTPQGSFNFTSFNNGGGVIAADGLSAAIAGNFFALQDGRFFGCLGFNCSDSTIRLRTIPLASGGTSFNVVYSSPADALASFQLTAATAVPFEFSPALGLGVLGGSWLVRKKLAKKSPKA